MQYAGRFVKYHLSKGMDALGDSKTVFVHINRLREKLEKDPATPEHIQIFYLSPTLSPILSPTYDIINQRNHIVHFVFDNIK